ncbi:Bug family tripartite tricarboxylate transporter substrate binding protein [Lacisediminimonas profundi]|uniref:Bug family tripartite tricarboxylate transporter substrate binding protein n=1 Tax=Lacisediminimonas profundi TaxID=2603856 RepID=UPI00124BC4DC|nr:tripartite tricarboxylate transporter substrate binding protein [Lacisediminimonas profundi]
MMRKILLTAVMAGLAFSNTAGAQSNDYPNRPIRIIVPFAAGGNTDVVARVTAQYLTQSLGQTVIVENKAGAGGMIATEYVAKAAPDGYTLLMSSTGPHTISPSLMAKINYDPVKDLAPVSNVSSNALVLLVNPSVPATSVKELIALAKAQPGKLSFGSAGIGGTTHLSAEMFKSMAGVNILHVPYKGGAPATAAALAGEVAITFANLSDALPQMKAGKLRALAVTSAARQPQAPDLPTIAEAGLPGYQCIVWNGLVAPGGTPADIVNKLSAAVQKITRTPAFQEKMTQIGSVPIGDTPEQFRTFVAKELVTWNKVVKDSGAKAN